MLIEAELTKTMVLEKGVRRHIETAMMLQLVALICIPFVKAKENIQIKDAARLLWFPCCS